MTGEVRTNLDVDAGEDLKDGGLVRVQEIDAYWLQRRITRAFGAEIEASKSQEVAEQVLLVLSSAADQRTVENDLVMSLGFEQFDLIKDLIKNRSRIVWCTRLGRAQDDAERRKIEDEMAALGPETAAILDALLKATRTSARDRQTAVEEKIRKEARQLRGQAGEDAEEGRAAGGGGGGGVAVARQIIDLEALTFGQGSHFRSNKSISLPTGSTKCVFLPAMLFFSLSLLISHVSLSLMMQDCPQGLRCGSYPPRKAQAFQDWGEAESHQGPPRMGPACLPRYGEPQQDTELGLRGSHVQRRESPHLRSHGCRQDKRGHDVCAPPARSPHAA